MADLPSILGGMAQGFVDFGKGVVDMFGTGGAAIGDLIEGARTGKVTTKNQDDFRKWLYQTDDTKDAAAKGLGTALNGVQTVLDYIPGVNVLTRNPLGNAAQGALGGLADEFKTYGADYDLGRAGQRAAVSGAAAAASGSLADALKGSSNALLSSNTLQGLARGATGGAITGGGYAAIDGGDVLEAAKQGAGMGALIGGATGAFQDFKPAKTYDMALTDDERAARIANAQKQIDDIGPVSRFSNNPDDIAKRARISELQGNIRAYQNGYDTAQDYADAMAAKRANMADTQSVTTAQGRVYAPNMGEIEYGAPVQDGYTRLYRGMTQEFDPQYNRNAMDNMNGYESWTDNYDLANRYGDGKYVYSIDVPTSRIANSLYDENPNSATYGDRNFISAIDKAAGLDGVDGNEYLLNTNDELRSGLTYNRVNAPKALEATLADADMAVNNPKLTPEQEAYFKDSVIRDENGNLMPLYHGSNSKFTVFDSSKGGQSNKTAKVGHWFTPNEEGAKNFANSVWYGDESEPTVYSTYLNVKNPKVYEAVDNSAQIKALNNEMDSLQRQLDGMRRGSDDFNATYKKYNDLAKQIENLSYGDPYEQFRSDIYAMEGKTPYQANVGGLGMMMDDENAATQKYVQSLRDQGYDGIIIRGTNYDNGTLGGVNDQYVVFDSNQIKNTNNLRPTENPDIRYSKAAPGQSLEKTLSNGDAEINRVGSANVAPVDPATLPESMRAVKGFIDKDYIKDIEKYAGKKYADMTDSELLDYALSKRKPEDRDIMRTAYEDMIKGGSSARKIAENTAKNNYLSAIGETEYSDASGDGLMEYLLHHGSQIGNNSRTKAADIELSDRLGIAPGNTFMRDNANPYDSYGSYSPYDTTISIGDKAVGENAIGTVGHERLHSFQTEALMNRYDKEVLDAYRDLSKDLDKYIKSDAEIAKLHADDPADLAYWGNKDEQQARMLQQYLENKKFTNTGGIRNRAKEWGNEINPAFDKFFDKLRDLSKRGVALPALAALFGGGAYMASQENDKEKEVK